jgi:hypothetical protein
MECVSDSTCGNPHHPGVGLAIEVLGGPRAEWKAIRDSNFWLIFASACTAGPRAEGDSFHHRALQKKAGGKGLD